jgi:hypothetical protein
VITACAIVLSVALQFNRLIEFRIASVDLQIPQGYNQTINYTYYYYTYSNFHYSDALKVMDLATSIFRDFILGVALVVIFNILILIQIKQVTLRRIFLTSGQTSQSVRVSLQAERRKSLMIIATGVNYFIGHFLKIVLFFGLATDSRILSLDHWNCYSFVAGMLLMASYVTPFFIYYFFNIHFRAFANQTFIFFLTPLFCKKREKYFT